MMRLTLVAAVAMVAVAVEASSAVADGNVIHAEATLSDVTFHDAYLSHACGFDVNDTLNAHTTATGYLNKDGRLATEFDTWSGFWRYSAPSTGKSVVQPLKITVTSDYGAGAVLGSSGVATAVGQGAGTYLSGPPEQGSTRPPGPGRCVRRVRHSVHQRDRAGHGIW